MIAVEWLFLLSRVSTFQPARCCQAVTKTSKTSKTSKTLLGAWLQDRHLNQSPLNARLLFPTKTGYFQHEAASSTVLSLLSDLTALLLFASLFFAVSFNFVMAESVVKVQGQCCLPPAATAGGQAIFRPFVECGPIRAPAATYLSQRKQGSQAASVPIEVENPTNPRSGSHDPEKEPFGQHSHSSHSLPYNHSRVTYADYEDEGDDSGLNQHAIWILVGSPIPGKIPSH